jgi:hypothetical protein
MAAEALTGTVLTFVDLPGLPPLPWGQTLGIFACALVSCLVVNDIVKVAMIKWRVPTPSLSPARAYAVGIGVWGPPPLPAGPRLEGHADERLGVERVTPHALVSSYGLSFWRTGKTEQRPVCALSPRC